MERPLPREDRSSTPIGQFDLSDVEAQQEQERPLVDPLLQTDFLLVRGRGQAIGHVYHQRLR